MKNANVIITPDDDWRELRKHDIYISEGKILEIGQKLTIHWGCFENSVC